MRVFTLLTFVGLATVGLFSSVEAQGRFCHDFEKFSAALQEQHQEHEVASGVAANGARLVLFTSKDGSSWTVLAVAGNNLACLMASGYGWEDRESPFRLAPPSEVNP